MSHNHTHDHDHAHAHAGNERRVFWVMLLTGGFMFAEIAGGIIAGSLALLADAGHMFTDAAALALAWWAFRIARRPADAERSYGYDRFQVIAAFLNGVALIVLVIWIAFEAIMRIMEPVDVLAAPMLVVASLGLLVNAIAFVVLHGAERENLNIQGALLHVLGDLLGSVAAIAAALIIMATGWTQIDPILSLLVAALILKSGWALVGRAVHILMEGTPESFDRDQFREELLAKIPGLNDIHHIHIWLLTAERPLLTMHADIAMIEDSGIVLAAIKSHLWEAYGIDHSTVQIETGNCADH